MRNQLLKEYIELVIFSMLNEQSTVSTSSTTGTGSTTSTTSTTGATGTTSTTASVRTGTTGTETDNEADTTLGNIEDKVNSNSEKINSINTNLTASRADATKMSTRTREMQAANKNIEKNMRDAASSTERLRDAGNENEKKDAYNKTSSALRGVADSVGTVVNAQANVADILNRQGARIPTENSS